MASMVDGEKLGCNIYIGIWYGDKIKANTLSSNEFMTYPRDKGYLWDLSE